MKIEKVFLQQSEIKSQNTDQQRFDTEPSFKAIGAGAGVALDFFGKTMQGIEDGGFLASFLIQDVIGMTTPRAIGAFLRDKEVTGHYNTQEGWEVLGREGLTGPIMMAVAPIMFALSAKVGKCTSVNSQLIKRYGNSLREILSKPNFDKSLLENKEKFKQEFYKTNIREMLSNTLGKENVSDETVNFVMERLHKYENISKGESLPKNLIGIPSKKKYKKARLAEVTEYINNIRYATSEDLSLLNKIKVGTPNDIKTFHVEEALEGLMKYSDDAIYLNKNLSKLNEAKAEDIKHSAITKRLLANVITITSTLGVLSVLPKLYIKSDISPGARTAQQLREKNEANDSNSQNLTNDPSVKAENSNVNFKAKNPKKSWLARFGKKFEKYADKDFFSKELEYNGHNFTNTLMEILSIFGLLAPRGFQAYQRAQVDENGKKDWTELYEIFLRDLTSSLSVVFAVPMLTRTSITSYENKSGFVLLHKDRTKSKKATFLDLINPYSKTHVLTNSEIKALYNGVDSVEKMNNFCKYIEKNGGDLGKILSHSEFADDFFKDKELNLKELASLDKKERNGKISSFFEGIAKNDKLDKKQINESITKLMKGTNPKKNKILSFARGLNSIPGLIATFFISPYILGWAIPQLTYANTRRIHEKAEKERQAKKASINTAA